MHSAYVERHRVARRLTADRDDTRDSLVVSSRSLRPTRLTGRRRPVDSKQRARSKLYNLTLDVNELRQQIQQLSLHRSLLYTRQLYTSRDDDGSAFRSAIEYFSVFCRGYRVSDHTPPAFVEAVADEQLTLGVTGLGRDMLLEQWRLYTAYFAIRYYKMHSVRVMAATTVDQDDPTTQSCILRGDGTFYGAFTMDALRMVFPAALRDPELTQRLLGKEMVTPIVFFLYFNEDGRMVRHDGETDLLAAVTRALGDAELAATIVSSANVAEESMVEATPDGRADDKTKPPLVEPVEHIARVKRNRSMVVVAEEEAEEPDQHDTRDEDNQIDGDLEQATDSPTKQSVDADPRFAIDYILS